MVSGIEAWTTVLDRVVVAARKDAVLRDSVRSLARSVLASTDADRSDDGRLVEQPRQIRSTVVTPLEAKSDDDVQSELLALQRRCQLKAKGARWAVERRSLLDNGAEFQAEIVPRDKELLLEGKNADCYLWMNSRYCRPPSEPEPFTRLADCYENLAMALALTEEATEAKEGDVKTLQETLELLAEAQSAVRGALESVPRRYDEDQEAVFQWLRRTTAERQIYVRRHMCWDDAADPHQAADLKRRILDAARRFHTKLRRTESWRRARQQAKSLANGDGSIDTEKWIALSETIDTLVGTGVPPSDIELRQLILPVIDSIPESEKLPSGCKLALRETNRYLATKSLPARAEAPIHTAEVNEVANLLRGRRGTLVGGDYRPHQRAAIKDAFEFAELSWIEVSAIRSAATVEPEIAKNDVAVVMLATRWAKHSFGDGMKKICDKYDKPLVRLTRGLNPNQVASEVLAQCGNRLRTQLQSTA